MMNKLQYIIGGLILANIPLVGTTYFFSYLFFPWFEAIVFIGALISLFIITSLSILGLILSFRKISYLKFNLLFTLPNRIFHWLLLVTYSIMLIMVIWYISTLPFFIDPFKHGLLLLLFSALVYFYFMFNGVLILLLNKRAV